MTLPSALLDSNVVIAMVAGEHAHHGPSVALMAGETRRFAVSAHSYAEAYATLTRRSAGAPFGWAAHEAWATLESVAAATTLVGLSPAQTFDAVRGYAQAGGTGARLYDRLIGQVAVHYGIPRLITWNLRHMASLFPELDVRDPATARD